MAKKKALDNKTFKKSGYKFRDRLNISKKAEILQKTKHKTLSKNNQSKNSSKAKDIDEIINPYFILEKYILFERIKTIKKIEIIEEKDKSDYFNISRDLLLLNLFLKKFRLDPGFRFTIYTEMDKNDKILRQIFRDLLLFFQDPIIFGELHTKFKLIEGDLESFEGRTKIHMRTERKFLSLLKTAFISRQNKKIWFYRLWKYYMEKGQVNEATAVESILMDFMTGHHHGYFLFWVLNTKSEEINAHYYLLNGIKYLIENIDPYFLDYVEAQCNNILLCEKMQNIIDTFNFNELKRKTKVLTEHLQDILSVNFDFFKIPSIYNGIYSIASIIYFQSLSHQEKIDKLNQFFGMEKVIQELKNNINLYNKDLFIADLPIWKEYGFLPDFRLIIENFLKMLEKNSNMNIPDKEQDTFLLVKFLCHSLIEQKLFNEAFQTLTSKEPIILEWFEQFKSNKKQLTSVLDSNSHLNAEILFLLGQISVDSENETLFKFSNYLLNILIENAENQHIKTKLIVIKSLLYRKKNQFKQEEFILNTINIDYQKFQKSKDINPLEVMHTFLPTIELFAEDQSKLKKRNVINEIQTTIVFEREPYLPKLPESYIIYSQIRRKFFDYTKDPELQNIVENDFELQRLNLICQKAQSLASFDKAILLSKKINLKYVNSLKSEDARIIMETLAFPYYYSKKFEEFEKYLNYALDYNTDDIYYDEYKVLINLINKKYEIASRILFKFYLQDASGKYSYLKSTFQHIMFYFKETGFETALGSLLNTNMAKEFAKYIDKIYCDVGFAIADLGYFEKAIFNFNRAIEYTHDSSLKAAYIGNIGTVYSDQGQYINAIIQFEEAKNIDLKNPQHWFSLGKMYQLQNNYIKAKEVYDKAIENFKEIISLPIEFKALSFLMEVYNKETVNLNSVHDKDAKAHLKQAQQLVRNINNLETLTNNTGIIFIALNNGFDSYFHSTFSKLFLNELKKRYPNYIRPPPEIRKSLPNGIKNIWNGKNMFLGQIIDLFKAFLNKPSDPSIKPFKEMIPNSISDKDIKTIVDFAKLSSET